jgi:hypothetical protein
MNKPGTLSAVYTFEEGVWNQDNYMNGTYAYLHNAAADILFGRENFPLTTEQNSLSGWARKGLSLDVTKHDANGYPISVTFTLSLTELYQDSKHISSKFWDDLCDIWEVKTGINPKDCTEYFEKKIIEDNKKVAIAQIYEIMSKNNIQIEEIQPPV